MIGIKIDFSDPEDFFVLPVGFAIIKYNSWMVINLFEKMVIFTGQFLYIHQKQYPDSKYIQ